MAYIGKMNYLELGGNTYEIEDKNAAPIASPSFTGTPTAPTPTAGDSSTQIATTEFVQEAMSGAGAGTVTSVGVSNATNGGLSVSGGPITTSGSITIGHSNVLSDAYTTEAILPIAIDKNGHISSYGTAITPMTSLGIGADVKSGTSTVNWTSSVSPNQYYWIHPGDNISLDSYSETGTITKMGVTVNAIVPTKTSDLTNDSGYITLNDIPTIPSITFNGSATASPSFYAPTTAGTSGYYLKSNGSGAPTWAEVTAGVSDVTVAGTSVVTNGVAAIAAPVQIVRW